MGYPFDLGLEFGAILLLSFGQFGICGKNLLAFRRRFDELPLLKLKTSDLPLIWSHDAVYRKPKRGQAGDANHEIPTHRRQAGGSPEQSDYWHVKDWRPGRVDV